ncbi:hypothetical protein BC826DRAFT_561505 [Russula brevipes]|nr:hypothetical protein BC826DRAFT_561505 [Russula brevipes]
MNWRSLSTTILTLLLRKLLGASLTDLTVTDTSAPQILPANLIRFRMTAFDMPYLSEVPHSEDPTLSPLDSWVT